MQGHDPFFHVIEFWIENRLMIEVAPPDMRREYENFGKTAATRMRGDPEALRLMRATHIKEPTHRRYPGSPPAPRYGPLALTLMGAGVSG